MTAHDCSEEELNKVQEMFTGLVGTVIKEDFVTGSAQLSVSCVNARWRIKVEGVKWY